MIREEEESVGYVGGWLSPLIVVAFTLGWTLLIWHAVGTRPNRVWQYGVTSSVPAESILTSEQGKKGVVPKQVELPRKNSGGGHAVR